MSISDEDVLVAQRIRTMRIVLGALVGGCLAFFVIAVIVRQGRQPGPPPAIPIMTYTSVWFAVFWTTLSFIVPTFFVRAERRKMAQAPEKPMNDPQSSPKPSDIVKLAGLYQMQLIVGTAIVEGCVFFFIITYMIEGSLFCLVGALVLLGIMIAKFPTRIGVERWVERQRELLQHERMGI